MVKKIILCMGIAFLLSAGTACGNNAGSSGRHAFVNETKELTLIPGMTASPGMTPAESVEHAIKAPDTIGLNDDIESERILECSVINNPQYTSPDPEKMTAKDRVIYSKKISDLADGSSLYFEAEDEARYIYSVKGNKKKMIFWNEPGDQDYDYTKHTYFNVSPDKKRIAFIRPLSWEVFGTLYIYNVDGSLSEIKLDDKYEKQITPKRTVWLDNENLFVLVSNTYGTSNWGKLYVFNTLSKRLVLSKKLYDDHVEYKIVDVIFENKTVTVKTLNYKNNGQDETAKTITFTFAELLDAVK